MAGNKLVRVGLLTEVTRLYATTKRNGTEQANWGSRFERRPVARFHPEVAQFFASAKGNAEEQIGSGCFDMEEVTAPYTIRKVRKNIEGTSG